MSLKIKRKNISLRNSNGKDLQFTAEIKYSDALLKLKIVQKQSKNSWELGLKNTDDDLLEKFFRQTEFNNVIQILIDTFQMEKKNTNLDMSYLFSKDDVEKIDDFWERKNPLILLKDVKDEPVEGYNMFLKIDLKIGILSASYHVLLEYKHTDYEESLKEKTPKNEIIYEQEDLYGKLLDRSQEIYEFLISRDVKCDPVKDERKKLHKRFTFKGESNEEYDIFVLDKYIYILNLEDVKKRYLNKSNDSQCWKFDITTWPYQQVGGVKLYPKFISSFQSLTTEYWFYNPTKDTEKEMKDKNFDSIKKNGGGGSYGSNILFYIIYTIGKLNTENKVHLSFEFVPDEFEIAFKGYDKILDLSFDYLNQKKDNPLEILKNNLLKYEGELSKFYQNNKFHK